MLGEGSDVKAENLALPGEGGVELSRVLMGGLSREPGSWAGGQQVEGEKDWGWGTKRGARAGLLNESG